MFEKPEFKKNEVPDNQELSREADPEKYRAISEAKSFEELFATIDQLGGIEGSQKFYDASGLKEKIGQVREGKRLFKGITRTGGLREKVFELFAEEIKKSEELEGLGVS